MSGILAVGQFLQELRLENDLEVESAATMIGIDPEELLRWEEGASYPTIDYVQSLANVYKVSVDELVQGRRWVQEPLEVEPIKDGPVEEESLDSHSEAPPKRSKLSKFMPRSLEWLGAITAVFIFVIVACLLIDLLSIGRITWSAITGVTIVFAWGLILPLFFKLTTAIMSTLIAFSALILPYLFTLDQVNGADNILTKVAVPITAVVLVYLWALYFMHKKLNLSLRRFIAYAAIGLAPVIFLVNYVVSVQFNVPLFSVWNVLVIIVLIAIGAGLIYWENRGNQPPSLPTE